MKERQESVGGIIARLRKQRGLTQGQLATYAQVTRSWLSLVERDMIEQPDREKLESIASVLRARPETLWAAAGYRVEPIPERTERSPQEILRELQASLRRQEEERPLILYETAQPASAGAGAEVEAEPWPYHPREGERGHRFVLVTVQGPEFGRERFDSTGSRAAVGVGRGNRMYILSERILKTRQNCPQIAPKTP